MVTNFIKKNIVMIIALILAVATSAIVPPDIIYLKYIDFRTITCLFCVLAVVCALKNVDFFYVIAKWVIHLFKTTRMSILALVYITFIGSMLIANDMALLTFLPLGYFVLSVTRKENHMAFTFIMQNIAANLGGMLTPFGNPQNLYLYYKFNIPNREFILIMTPLFVVAIVIITICCLCVKSEPLEIKEEKIELPLWRTVLYLVFFALSIVIVFRVIPYQVGFAIILLGLLIADRGAIKKVDYPLLLTFVFFFIFAGNMARIEPVKDFLGSLMQKNTLIYSVLSCQVISNVPSAILLSQFTSNYHDLLLGVNIGGAGTLIASLASLITFKEYVRHNPKKIARYLGVFHAYNFGFVIILTTFAYGLSLLQ